MLLEEDIYERTLDLFIAQNKSKLESFTGNVMPYASSAYEGELGLILNNKLGKNIKGKRVNYLLTPLVYYGHVHDAEGKEVLFGNNIAGICVNSHFPFSLDEKIITEKEDNDIPRPKPAKIEYLQKQITNGAKVIDGSDYKGEDLDSAIEPLTPENVNTKETVPKDNPNEKTRVAKQDFLSGFLEAGRMLQNSIHLLENESYNTRFSVTPLLEPENDEYAIMELNRRIYVENQKLFHHDRLGVISRLRVSKKGEPMAILCKKGRCILTKEMDNFRAAILAGLGDYSFEPPEW